MFAMGRPIGTMRLGSPATQDQNVTSTDASVGPYRLCSSTPGSRVKNRSCKAYGNASPLQITRFRQWAALQDFAFQEYLQHAGHEVQTSSPCCG